MSHFAVGVFCSDKTKEIEEIIEETLIPFKEGGEFEIDKKYLIFDEISDKGLEKCKKKYEEYKKNHKEKILNNDCDNKHFNNFDKYMIFYMGYSKKIDYDGNIIYGTYYNPNAKWDWYEIGGRWNNYLINKNGYRDSIMKINDIDFDYYKAEEIRSLCESWAKNKEYYIEKRNYKDKEEFINKKLNICPFYAFIDEEGEWHSVGEMGWFGCSTETEESKKEFEKVFKEKILNNKDPEAKLAIVDCHI